MPGPVPWAMAAAARLAGEARVAGLAAVVSAILVPPVSGLRVLVPHVTHLSLCY